MQAGDQRTRAISEAGDKHEAPGRTPRWKRGHVDLGGEVEQRPAIAGCRDHDFDDVVRQVEVRIDLPAQRLDRAGSVDDPLDEARHGGIPAATLRRRRSRSTGRSRSASRLPLGSSHGSSPMRHISASSADMVGSKSSGDVSLIVA